MIQLPPIDPRQFRGASLSLARTYVSHLQSPRPRTMRRFAEEEIVIPTGLYEGRKFSCDRQPFTGLFFDEIDSGHWVEVSFTGPSQIGKSLASFVIPILYHLFELNETVICAVPMLDPIARDKWTMDILPVLLRTRYANLIPTTGSASRGGRTLNQVIFNNGATLKFMGGQGSDKGRASFTSRVVVFTEVDEMEKSAETSVEANAIKQILARLRAYEYRDQRIYKECTVSVPEGHIWSSITGGSASVIVLPCPYCFAYVTPEREHFQGWQQATTILEAERLAHFSCPSCSHPWTDVDRYQANRNAKIVHGRYSHYARITNPDSFSVSDTKPDNPEPQTRAFGLRISAVNNCLKTAASMAVDEYNRETRGNTDDDRRESCQFVWCIPYRPPDLETVDLNRISVVQDSAYNNTHTRRTTTTAAAHLVVGVDVGLYRSHWVSVAFYSDTIRVVDYNVVSHRLERDGLPVTAKDAPYGHLFPETMNQFVQSVLLPGWELTDKPGERRVFNLLMVDGRYQGDDPNVPVVTTWAQSFRQLPGVTKAHRCRICIGHGSANYLLKSRRYRSPTRRTKRTPRIGHEYFEAFDYHHTLWRIEHNADHWKTTAQTLFTSSPPGILLPRPAHPNEHITFQKHIAAEHRESYHDPKRGQVTEWVVDSSANHYLDALTLALIGGHRLGYRYVGEGNLGALVSSDTETDSKPPTKPKPRPKQRTSVRLPSAPRSPKSRPLNPKPRTLSFRRAYS